MSRLTMAISITRSSNVCLCAIGGCMRCVNPSRPFPVWLSANVGEKWKNALIEEDYQTTQDVLLLEDADIEFGISDSMLQLKRRVQWLLQGNCGNARVRRGLRHQNEAEGEGVEHSRLCGARDPADKARYDISHEHTLCRLSNRLTMAQNSWHRSSNQDWETRGRTFSRTKDSRMIKNSSTWIIKTSS